MKKKRRFKMSAAEVKASYAARAAKRAATMARKAKGKAILAKAPTPRADALRSKAPSSRTLARNLDRDIKRAHAAAKAAVQENPHIFFPDNPAFKKGPVPVSPTSSPEPLDVAVARIVDNLSTIADLDVVLVAIRAKVQGLSDERPPSELARCSADEVVRHLSQAIRAARYMRNHWGAGGFAQDIANAGTQTPGPINPRVD